MSDPQSRRKGKALQLSLPDTSSRPGISALYMVTFDVRTGYTISWKRAVPGLELADSVEFKSLPSGLHNVDEDLVYFVHEDAYAGISAFVNKTAAKHERGALMLAVGALIRLDNGRLGRSWRHADRLKELARQLVASNDRTNLLDAYWELYRTDKKEADDADPNTKDKVDTKASKDTEEDSSPRPSLEQAQAKSLMPGAAQELSLFHPARSIPTMLDTFGPLIYPLYKAALLRKRILILLEAPVELACNFVYNISILSNIPSSLAPLIPLEPLPIRLLPLFSVGIHDSDALATQGRPSISSTKNDGDTATTAISLTSEGWVACTTDDVLRIKKDLYDVIVTLPSQSKENSEKQWPRIQTSEGGSVCANNRDVRRYQNLRKQLGRRMVNRTPLLSRNREDSDIETSDDEEEPLLGPSRGDGGSDEPFPDLPPTRLEPIPWSALAYSSFVWWASAGEKGLEVEEEAAHDSSLWSSVEASRSYTEGLPSGRPASLKSSYTGLMTDGSPSAPEMAMIAYFHRLTTSIMEILANLVDDTEDEEETEARESYNRTNKGENAKTPPAVIVDGEDMQRMGLDPWSEGDRIFVAQLLELYWGRKADVRGGRIECCGVRIC